MTHLFHPLAGRDFEFVAHRQNWGEDRVHLVGAENPVTLCDLGILTDQAAEPVLSRSKIGLGR